VKVTAFPFGTVYAFELESAVALTVTVVTIFIDVAVYPAK
jgi:hypothetical protein